MRKILCFVMITALLIGAAACGGNGTESSAPAGSGETAATTATTTAVSEESGAPTTAEGTAIAGTSAPATTVTTAARSVTKSTATTAKTTAKPTTTTTVSKEQYFADKEKITVSGSESDPRTWVYTLGKNGVRVREVTFDSGKGGEPAEIVQISDIHFNTVNVQDMIEDNPSLMATYVQRFGSFPGSKDNLNRCMEYAGYFDQIVITGDAIDYLSYGNLELLQQRVWDRAPTALVALGNHDAVRCMGLPNDVADPTTLESRYAILQGAWKHNIFYTSRVVKNKAMVIQLDNGFGQFRHEQIAQLEADLATAREKHYVVLLFYHVPLATNGVATGSEDNRKVYELITNNADVIRGAFCGHEHVNQYGEIKAKTKSGQNAVIPQYVLETVASYAGAVLKITVK